MLMMKRLHIERFYLNRQDEEYPMTVRVMLRLKDKVDEQMLDDALKAAQKSQRPRVVNLSAEAVRPIARHKETVVIRLSENQMMHCVPSPPTSAAPRSRRRLS